MIIRRIIGRIIIVNGRTLRRIRLWNSELYLIIDVPEQQR